MTLEQSPRSELTASKGDVSDYFQAASMLDGFDPIESFSFMLLMVVIVGVSVEYYIHDVAVETFYWHNVVLMIDGHGIDGCFELCKVLET
ncbi:unnamed protein product [Vicia faba]|uniref:Uncharacterized protein n=1 Tax=Vicia faba TaxID=3906 RepID=A0AAV0ZXF1_VICFA|nr:unnamed protein product [Vicia faba]